MSNPDEPLLAPWTKCSVTNVYRPRSYFLSTIHYIQSWMLFTSLLPSYHCHFFEAKVILRLHFSEAKEKAKAIPRRQPHGIPILRWLAEACGRCSFSFSSWLRSFRMADCSCYYHFVRSLRKFRKEQAISDLTKPRIFPKNTERIRAKLAER
jgi:hypothetical protein